MNDLEGNPLIIEKRQEPWLVVSGLLIMPTFILFGVSLHNLLGSVIVTLGGLSSIPAVIYGLWMIRKTKWSFLPAATALFLGTIHFGFLAKGIDVAFGYLKRKYF